VLSNEPKIHGIDPQAEYLNILCDYQFVFYVLDEIYVSHTIFDTILDAACVVLRVHMYEM